MRAVQKKSTQPDPKFTGREDGQERSSRAKYLAILSMEGAPACELPADEKRVISVLKSHPKSKKMDASERERLAEEVMGVLEQLEGEEREIAAKLFRLVLGAEEHVPFEYMGPVTEITLATMAEERAAQRIDTMVETEVQRPFMIAQFSREIKRNMRYFKELPELEEGIREMDADIRGMAEAALKTLYGKGGHDETLRALTLLEWIPSRTIDEYGPAGAILEVCELWQKIRSETGADDKIALAGVCALGAILDDEIRPNEMAARIIDNLSIDLADIHEGIVKAVKLTLA